MPERSAPVVSIDEFRQQQERPKHPGGKCAVTLHAPDFRLNQTQTQSLSCTIELEFDRYEELIDALRNAGGIWLPPDESTKTGWFLPWPPAAIAVRPL